MMLVEVVLPGSPALDILLVEDEPAVRMSVAYPLCDAGHRVFEAADGAEAVSLISQHVFDVAICDIRLPKVDGLTLLRRLRREAPGTAVILMTAYANVDDAVAALREGAYDYVTKPFDTEKFTLGIIARIAAERALVKQREQARAELAQTGAAPLIGRSLPMVRLLDRIRVLEQSDAPVLITGESGTGKELVARTLHEGSARRGKPFVAVNCAAVPETLLEAELFGHERGAFTGAVRKREGRFRAADGGTLLLDEVGEIPLHAQTKLLRVLEGGAIEPLGTHVPVRVDVRLISATHQNLKERIAEGRFREDLFYRLNVLDVVLPPLRERKSDLPLLLEHFLGKYTPAGETPPRISSRAWARLLEYPFPGNVREFAHAVERAVVLARGGEIDIMHLPVDLTGAPTPNFESDAQVAPLAVALKQFERQHLLRALALAGGKRTRAAELLQISRKNLWEKLRQHGISEPDLDD